MFGKAFPPEQATKKTRTSVHAIKRGAIPSDSCNVGTATQDTTGQRVI